MPNRKSKVPADTIAAFRKEGREAYDRRERHSDCPYKMSTVSVGGAALAAVLRARAEWIVGYDGRKAEVKEAKK